MRTESDFLRRFVALSGAQAKDNGGSNLSEPRGARTAGGQELQNAEATTSTKDAAPQVTEPARTGTAKSVRTPAVAAVLTSQQFKVGEQWFYRGNRSPSWFCIAGRPDGSCQGGIMERAPIILWPLLEEIATLRANDPRATSR
mgnify:CR=1 FL=1